jgi:hypothetical protein
VNIAGQKSEAKGHRHIYNKIVEQEHFQALL